MTFEWDENKNRTNKKKHGVTFDMAVRAYLDNKRIERLDTEHSTLEEVRINIIGRVSGMLLLFVVCTDRGGGRTRIISARKAEPEEEEAYYENYGDR